MYTGIADGGTGREELIFISFRFVVRTNCDFDRGIAGALLILRELFVLFGVRILERLSSNSRFRSIRVLLRRIGGSLNDV
jgi:hypothetical protein